MKKIILASLICILTAGQAFAAEVEIAGRTEDGYILYVDGGDFSYSEIDVLADGEDENCVDSKLKLTTTITGDVRLITNTQQPIHENELVYSKRYDGVDFSNGIQLDGDFEDGRYDFVIVKSNTHRSDIYVNGYMIGNNVCQYGSGRNLSDSERVFVAHDILVSGGKIDIQTLDFSRGQEDGGWLDYVAVYKAPECVEQKRNVYVLGDSLVCTYYGDLNGIVGDGRTGWGDTLKYYFDDSVNVINFANSAQYAKGLSETAMPAVVNNGSEGDIVIIEAGYNDRTYSSEEEMAESMQIMIDSAKEKGMIPVIVSPNASAHDYKSDVSFTHIMSEVAEKNPDILYINLAELSYDYLKSLYGEGDEAKSKVDANFNLSTTGGDTLHSSFLGAMKWGAVIAQQMKDYGFDFIDTEYSWTVNDTEGNTIVCNVK